MLTVLPVLHLPPLASGINGLLDSVSPGLACGSDTAHLSLLGYDPQKYYRGRGAFETMGAGLEMKEGDIAFKSNFAVVDPESGIVLNRRADREFHVWGQELCDFLNGSKLPSFPDVEVAVKYATEHRCGVRLRGANLSDEITGTDPLKDNRALLQAKAAPQGPDSAESAEYTARVVNELHQVFHDRLNAHPLNVSRRAAGQTYTNAVLFRGCGARIHVPYFQDQHGMKPFMIAPTAIIRGLGESVGIEAINVDGATGDYRTDISAKGKAAVMLLTDPSHGYEFGFVHIKAVDDAGHDRDHVKKVEFLQKVDTMIGEVEQTLREHEKSTGGATKV